MSSKWRQKMNWKSNLVFLKMVLWSVLVFKYLHCAERCTVYIFPSQHNVIWVVHNIQNGRCHCLINCFWTDWKRLFRVPWTARSNQSILKKSVLNIHWKDWCWSWTSNTLATWREELTHWKRPWCWERLKAGGEVIDRGWDGWMASPTQWTWVWASSRSWWWTGKPGVLQSMRSQRVGHYWATELN